MGDGVLIYFGYPQAHEDDAERAVRAGLELVAAVSDLKTHAALQTRVGIATGLVVVGDLIGSGASQEQAIVGETPNLAARLQGVAEPNSVVIAESTRKLVGNLFELEDLGAQGPQGYRGAGASLGGTATGFGRRPLRGFPHERTDRSCRPGRRTRLAAATMVERQRPAKAKWCCSPASGHRQVSTDGGAAGTSWLLNHTHACATSAHRSTPTARSIPSLAKWSAPLGSRTTTAAQAKLDKLDAVLAQSFTPRQDAALFAEMLSLPNDGRYPSARTGPAATATEDAGGAYCANGGVCPTQSSADDFRGRALDRPYEP